MPLSKKTHPLSPLMKYPGGKEKELKYILPNLPTDALNYYEPFVGAGSVFFSINSNHYFINDKSRELMNLYSMISQQNDDFFNKLEALNHNWSILSDVIRNHNATLVALHDDFKEKRITEQYLHDSISHFVLMNAQEFNGLLNPQFNVAIDNFVNELKKNFFNKIRRMVRIEEEKGDLSPEDILQNIEAAFKSAFYMHFRYIYNNVSSLNISTSYETAIYFFLREFCYSSMFRYNRKGEFNVPYGGISYNNKSLTSKIAFLRSEELINQLNNTTMAELDFFDFMKNNPPKGNDFVFLDPPYDTEFSTYAKNAFGKKDQIRLANYLKSKCDAYFMLIIKNTDFISKLYPDGTAVKNGRTLRVRFFDKKYMVSFQDRNEKNVVHLLITNY